MGLSTTPRTWTTTELVTAAYMNTEVRDALTGIQAAWTAYTPAWTAVTVNPSVGNGTITGSYLQIGKTVLWQVKLTAGGTTTFGTGGYFISCPPGLTPISGYPCGNGLLQDVGVNTYTLTAAYLGDAGGFRFYTTVSPAGVWTNASPFTFGTTDIMSASGSYQIP